MKEIVNTGISIAVTGTPGQIKGLVSGVEDGLFSRFLFTIYETSGDFRNPFSAKSAATEEILKEAAKDVARIYNYIDAHPFELNLTKEQETKFVKIFQNWSEQFKNKRQLIPSTRRLGVSTFRICMVLSAIRRWETKSTGAELYCDDQDFELAMSMAATFIAHAGLVYKLISKGPITGSNSKMIRFFESLPKSFTRAKAIKIGVSIDPRTIDNWLKKWLTDGSLKKVEHGKYCKASVSSNLSISS